MKWIFPEEQPADIVSFLLEQRNISDSKAFFYPSEAQIHSFSLLHDISKAAQEIAKAIKSKTKIAIHGDFDVDGVTATTVMWRFLYKDLGANVIPYIPSRFTEGYGLSRASLDAIVASGVSLVITVDCGVKDVELIHEYSDRLKFIITDHHTLLTQKEVDTTLPYIKKVGEYYISTDALAVVHPKLGNYPFTEICGASVSWKVCSAVNELMGKTVDMSKYLDLVALGTVCDIMPLYNENRSIVSLGLQRMKNTANPGLKSLLELSNFSGELNEYTLGFQIGPRINAAGRLNHALEAVRMLSTDEKASAAQIASRLDTLNTQRQDLTKQYLIEAEAQIDSQKENFVYIISGKNWPEGIVGLIAGKLSEKYSRPVLVASESEGLLKGSARSIESFDIAKAFKSVGKYLQRHGGHVQAAGFSLKLQNWEVFKEKLNKYAAEKINPEDLEHKLVIDCVVEIPQINQNLIERVEQFAPFGLANPKPIFALLSKKITDVRYFGNEDEHVKFGVTDGNDSLAVLAFGLGEKFKQMPSVVDIAGSFFLDTFNNRNLPTLKLKEIRGD